MPRIAEESIERVAAASDIVEIIGGYFPLKRAGSSWRALCPFHREKSPSFNISPQKQAYYCFGCGAGGSVFKFVMEYERIDFATAVDLVGRELAEKARDISLELYSRGAAWAAERGIIIADTKLEFGLDEHGVLHVMDEMLTPDSSRFWPADQYRVGISPPSYDKQFVRDYLETLDWNKTAPGPHVPADVIEGTRLKYAEALARLADLHLD